jgi:hypothetical protein
MDPLHATIEQFAAEGFTHVECYCPRCRPMHFSPATRGGFFFWKADHALPPQIGTSLRHCGW